MFYPTSKGPVMRDRNGEEFIVRDHSLDATAFVKFLELLYQDTYGQNLFEGYSGSAVQDIWDCANQYNVKALKDCVVAYLYSSLNVQTAMPILEFAMMSHEENLAQMALGVIDRNFALTTSYEESKRIKVSTLVKILERDTLDISEDGLLVFTMEWAESECGRKGWNQSPKNRRKVMGSAFLEIRFALLSAKAISGLLQTGFISFRETTEMFLQNHVKKSYGIGNDRYGRVSMIQFKSAKRLRRPYKRNTTGQDMQL